ncbi:hypothetical protein EDB81DRAFT_950673 [Dactylonectria macrodidyma]|uniref:Schlafen group 3-like DNA/RNA helicase domain-containing protein n=1 Tax=Dactylonectria macrodidyma TaxID=307937 RepID=A0A9P9E161_9HYPO|nr:hypothetical protein EDB81DRAFT_950673 [Dactylonectria macrodidyma]
MNWPNCGSCRQRRRGKQKTVAAIYLINLLVEIQTFTTLDDLDSDVRFATFFTDNNRRLLQGLRVGLVVPQQSLRSSIKAVVKKTPGLQPSMVMTLFEWDREMEPSIFLQDAAQSVRPADLLSELLSGLVADAHASRRRFQLQTQMRVQAGSDFVSYVRWILDARPLSLLRRDVEVGLACMVAGYAWEWKMKKDKTAFDIVISDTQLCWNSIATDWISSSNALKEVGSIYKVQGYDLNYVGVIIGSGLRFDPARRRLFIDRDSYFDKKGKENNPAFGRTYSDNDLLRFVTQIYAVLMTRGIRGTYVYVCDPGL